MEALGKWRIEGRFRGITVSQIKIVVMKIVFASLQSISRYLNLV